MFPRNKTFIVWTLYELGLCEDVIRWEICKYLVDWEKVLINKIGVDWRENIDQCIHYCARYGEFDIVKWLRKVSSIEETSSSDDLILWWSCIYNRLDIVTWLYNICRYNNSSNESVFITCCNYGVIDVAKWFYKNKKVNVYTENNKAFRGSCHNGHLDIAKWLFAISSSEHKEINIKNDISLREIYVNGHLDVAEWLVTIR